MASTETIQQHSCPRCGSTIIKARRSSFFFTAGIVLIGLFFISAFVNPPLGVGGMLVGLGLVLFAPFARGIFQCQKCRKFWKVKAE